ncbi:unnamed protein product [Dibothriocephalus latus]|uniref:Uncharacterized protein n=1 Tax=Dibothriocephalus latus TaxID=60516 RepID=A0A3P7N829_DIBLA|nr:unnamed protein product [Dibothriocephalus latus]
MIDPDSMAVKCIASLMVTSTLRERDYRDHDHSVLNYVVDFVLNCALDNDHCLNDW